MDAINPAQYDTRVMIEKSTIAKNGSDRVKTWSQIGKAWAMWDWANASENVSSNQLVTDQTATVTIRHRTDIGTDCRLVVNGSYYYVTSITPSHRMGPITLTVSKRDNE